MRAKGHQLNDNDRGRYLRQMAIDGFGEAGQRSLKDSTVTVMGVGGLGSPVALYLAAAGVGKLVLVDFQAPELSNLNRQVLHWEDDVGNGTLKAVSAANKLRKMNSEIEIVTKTAKIGKDDLGGVVEDSVVIVDCLDNFDARRSLNLFCIKERVPMVHAAVEGFSGQLTVIVPGSTPCLECLFPHPLARKPIIPIIGFTAGVFGSMEAAEAVKLITGIGEPLTGKLLLGDVSSNYWEIIEVEKSDRCPICGKNSLALL